MYKSRVNVCCMFKSVFGLRGVDSALPVLSVLGLGGSGSFTHAQAGFPSIGVLELCTRGAKVFRVLGC